MAYHEFTPPGKVIKEFAQARSIKQLDLAKRLGISEKHMSNLINGKVRLTETVAISLENVFSDTTAEFWLNFELKYRESITRSELNAALKDEKYLKKMSKKFMFDEVVDDQFQLSEIEKANDVLKILGIASFECFAETYKGLSAKFFTDGGKKEPLILWLKKSEKNITYQNDIPLVKYDKDKLKALIPRLKKLVLVNDGKIALKKLRRLLNSVGVYLVMTEALTNSKARGALTDYYGNPAIHISLRYKKHDYIWFAFFHELAHLVLHYPIKEPIVSLERDTDKEESENECEAHAFSRNILIDKDSYDTFIERNNITEATIRLFAQSQNTTPDIVLGRLQHDGIISDFAKFSKLKFDFI